MRSTGQRSREQESRAAIQRLYIAMRHLFIRGSYKPLGKSGEAIIESLMTLQPEIYGAITDPERVELDGLLYVFQRLPHGIEECRYVKLVSKEGYEHSHFDPLVPSKRRRNCYRIDDEQIFIEMTRGRSDIYDVLTHLTFMYIESEKIRRNSQDIKGGVRREWLMLEKIVEKEQRGEEFDQEVAFSYLSTILGRTFDETFEAYEKFEAAPKVNSLFHVAYWLGRRSMEEFSQNNDREISFSSMLRERIGHHIYGETWADNIKQFLLRKEWIERPIHIISANLHSVMNSLYGFPALDKILKVDNLEDLASELSLEENDHLREKVEKYALQNGMYLLDDESGANITVQLYDLNKIQVNRLPKEIRATADYLKEQQPLLLVMDYAFGEQAYETMDELLKPMENGPERIDLNVLSISIMGKAGTLRGDKGDIMVPNAHIFEGTADNYPFENDFSIEDFKGNNIDIFEGPMITVLGTSLQNRDILRYFQESSWRAVGLEMEGAHYQKAIQAASKIRNNISEHVILRYAYYASDNPLISGHTLASGSLGLEGVKPTYLITSKILERILYQANK